LIRTLLHEAAALGALALFLANLAIWAGWLSGGA